MRATDTTPSLLSVVRSYDRLSVEDYQRSYSWGKEQIDDLFEDLKDSAATGENHFFGTLILQENENNRKEATVVDGQQRLTTLFVLVAALRDAIHELQIYEIAPRAANMMPINVRQKAWGFLYPSTNMNQHRFVSNRFLRELMQKYVINEPLNRSELRFRDRAVTLNFRKAVRQIRELVRQDLINYSSNESKLERIDVLLDTLFDRFLVLRVTTDSLSESLEIFLTLNNRGLALGPSDLVRGEIMAIRGYGKEEKDQLQLQKDMLEEWQGILEVIGEPEVFLRHYLVSTIDEKVQKKKVVATVVKNIWSSDVITKQKNAELFWQDLVNASSVYGSIINPTMGGDCEYHVQLLEGLSKSHRIILLNIFRSNYEASDQNELVRLVFVLAFRWSMAGKNAQRLEDNFQDLGSYIRQQQPAEDVMEKLKGLIKTVDFDVLRYFSIDADSAYPSRALLHAVNRATTTGANYISLDNKKLHLEHIAPQSASDHWLESTFESAKNEYQNYDTLIGAIGNLTLLDSRLNLQSSNNPFDQKKIEYEKSTLAVARDLCGLANWNKSMIELRTKWLVEMFELIWSPEKTKDKVVSFTSWYKDHAN